MPRLNLPEDTAPRVEVRVRQAPENRRGSGAWKVAYADFVTALMALFIVLWLMNSSPKVKSSISGYFLDPRGFTRTMGAGPANSGEGLVVQQDNVTQICRRQLEQALRAMPEFGKLRDNVKFSVTGEGLRIDLLENEQGMFFVSGSPTPTPAGGELLRVLAGEIGRLPNSLVIEGHTDAKLLPQCPPGAGIQQPGSWPPIALMPRAACCTSSVCGSSRWWRCAGLPIKSRSSPRTLSTRGIGGCRW